MSRSTTEADRKVAAAAEAKRRRSQRPFPACAFEEALQFAKEIATYGSGQPVRKLSFFDHIKKAPDSGPSRQLITNAGKYGLTVGGYQAEHLKLTDDGARAVDDDAPVRERAKARVKLAILDQEPFNVLYERFKGNKLPARNALADALTEQGIDPTLIEEAVDTFIVNARFVGVLQTLSGADRLVSVEHLLDSLPSSNLRQEEQQSSVSSSGSIITSEQGHFEAICFYISPIGEDGSEHRKHSDLFLGSLVEPAIEPFKLKVIRADAIDKPGTITRQVIEYILRSRLVVADLSFHNPNVFYELALRHAARKPVVQIIRAADRIPFDLSQTRTVKIDTSDIYSLVPKLVTYQSEISSQVRRALEDPDAVDNPITAYYPAMRVSLEQRAGDG